jgi:hypothetical protein
LKAYKRLSLINFLGQSCAQNRRQILIYLIIHCFNG